MRKKQKKSKEEKAVEEFFPVYSDNLRFTIEKSVKASDLKILEEVKSSKKLKRFVKKKNPEKTRKTLKKEKEFKPKQINLKKGGYELIVTEKPQAALKIASALGKFTKRNAGSVPYYEVNRNGKEIIVACAVGHLFTLKQSSSGTPTFDISWVPNYLVRKQDFSKKYYNVLLKLIQKAGSLTIATDYDVEGEVIGLNVVRFIGGQKDASRMKFSTLTEEELNKSYESKSDSLNWGQAIAGETRHFLDWYYGINLSRALMEAIKTTGSFRIMSIGRVQGPTLKLIVEKEKSIQEFKSQIYWQIFIKISDGKNSIELIHNKDIFNKNSLDIFNQLEGKKAKAETKKSIEKIPPLPPFNLTNLQTEVYKFHKITPSKTLQIAQSLYLSGLISYPRTSSQKLPPSINYDEILNKIAKIYKADKLLSRKKPIEGNKTDPAHPSIYPTGERGKLSEDEKRVYDLIAKRFIALFSKDAIKENKTISLETNNLRFFKKGISLQEKGWTEIYPSNIKEIQFPDLNGEVTIEKVRFEEKETQPPKRFSPASIVAELEKRNLGTKATRASILETLYDREYIKDTSIKATPLGISLIETLAKHSPIIIEESLTRNFEKDIDLIQRLKKELNEKQERILSKARQNIKEICNKFESEKSEIGEELLKANVKFRNQQKEENKLNVCPICKKGYLTTKYSKKTKRYFIACDKYPECKNTYSLPPYGLMKKAGSICEECGFPKIMAIQRGKRPWVFCFNPQCPTNKARIEEYKRKQELNKEEH